METKTKTPKKLPVWSQRQGQIQVAEFDTDDKKSYVLQKSYKKDGDEE